MVYKRSWLVFFLTISTVFAVWSSGVQENRIAKAKELIAQKNYNEAILLLTRVVKEEPDRLDQAQELLDQIRRARNVFNDDFERLLQVLYTEQDEGKALEIIKAMEATDKSPNPEMQRQIKQAKRSARLIFYQKRFNSIMEQGLTDLNKKAYDAAVNVYLTGYSLARDEFDENDFGNVLRDEVFRALSDLQNAAKEFVQKTQLYKALIDRGKTIFAGNETEIAKSLPSLVTPLKEMAILRRRIYFDSSVFATENEIVKKMSPDLGGGDFFLSYAYLVSRGRPTVDRREGVIGSVDRLWKETLDAWMNIIRSRTDDLFTKASDALDADDWNVARSDFQTVELIADSGLQTVALWNLTAYPSTNGVVSNEYSNLLNEIVPVTTYLINRRNLATEGQKASEFKLSESQVIPSQIAQRESVGLLRTQVGSDKTDLGEFAKKASLDLVRQTTLAKSGWKLVDNSSFWTAWENRWNIYHQQSLALEASLVDRRGQLDFSDLSQRYTLIENGTKEIQSLVDGVKENDGNSTVVYRYPLQASQRLEKEQVVQDKLQKDLQNFVGEYRAEPDEVKTQAVAAWPLRGSDLLAKLEQLRVLRGQLLDASRNNYSQATVFRQEGQKLISRVVQQVAAENFQNARALLNQAAGRYSESLNLQEDAAFRQSSDAETKRLFALILKGENELVIRDVRKLITQGSQAYLTGQFPQAEQNLVVAQNRWSTTNTQPNPEVEYWLGLARNALSINTGRIISPTDPLYNEIQQLLNFARNDYESAKDFLQKKNGDRAKVLLLEAQTTLGKVLLPFPLNQEARVLNLKIQQSRDPEIFPTLFRDNFNAAVLKLRIKAQEGYNDLLDLKTIQPDYPGLGDAIKSARLLLGIDRTPPNPADLKESRNLTTLAKRIYDANNVGQFTAALEQVNQALRLDPTNTVAQDLKDRLSVFNPSATFMTPTQLNEFNSIVNLFATGRRLEAQSLLNQYLIRNPGLVNDPRVKELQRRLQAAS